MPAQSRPQVFLADADSLASNTDPCMLILQIERGDIEQCNLASTLEKLLTISDSPENARLYHESLTFIVSGYDHDKRELPEIPEVRAFFAKLVQEWPHWIWFLARDMGAVALLFALQCKVKIHRKQGSYGTEFLSMSEVKNCFLDLLSRGDAMFTTFGLSDDEVEKSMLSAMEEIGLA